MFFSERIRSIKPTDRVLEIGPGGSPHDRADVILERRFDDEALAKAQRGYADQAIITEQTLVYYDGGRFPFEDREFDYVICSHVLEHVPEEELDLFISELRRVANRGYLEFPNVFYELINYQDVHLWLMNNRNDIIYFMDKSLFTSNYVHKAYREMFYSPDGYMQRAFSKYQEFFFCGFEWENEISFQKVNCFDDLVDEEEYERFKKYFSNFQPEELSFQPEELKMNTNQNERFIDFVKRSLRFFKRGLRYGKSILRPSPNHTVHRTAQLEKRDLIEIKKGAEVKDYVIIRTYSNPVVIGEFTQINPFTVIYGGSGVYIGDNVMIAPHCMIAAGDHDFKQTEKPIRFAGHLTKGPIVIEDNVWIGANCTITDGVRIGKDAVVAANSVVTKDVAPYDIVGGVPAKVIANRKSPKVALL